MDFSEKARGHYNKGNELYLEDDFEGALDEYKKAIQLDATKPEYFVKQSICSFALEEYAQALGDAEDALRLDGNSGVAYLRKGMALLALHEPKLARSTFEHGRNVDQGDKLKWDEWIAKAREGEEDLAQDCRTEQKVNEDIPFSVGVSTAGYSEMDDVTQTGFTETTPSSPTLKKVKKEDSSFNDILSRGSKKEKDMWALREKEKGNDAFKVGDYDQAIAHYSKAIQLDPTNPALYSNRATAHYCQHSLEVSRTFFLSLSLSHIYIHIYICLILSLVLGFLVSLDNPIANFNCFYRLISQGFITRCDEVC